MDRLLLIYFWTSIFAFIVSLVGLGLLVSVATDLNIIELKEDIRYSSIISNIFKLSDWNIAKFTSEYVKKNEDINFVVKCWLEAANIQNVWKKREK